MQSAWQLLLKLSTQRLFQKCSQHASDAISNNSIINTKHGQVFSWPKAKLMQTLARRGLRADARRQFAIYRAKMAENAAHYWWWSTAVSLKI